MISGFKENSVYQDEGQHVQSVFKPAKFHGGLGRFGFDPEAHLTEKSALISEDNKRKLFSEWKEYWDLNRPYLLEQSPPDIIRTRFLQEIFPGSYFIVIKRHPVPVSFETQRAMGDNKAAIYSLIKHWVVVHEVFSADMKYLKNVFILKYEDFVRDPQGFLDRICSFLGIHNHNTIQEILSDRNAGSFIKWNEQRRKIFFKCYHGLIIRKFEKRVNQLGYSLYEAE